MVLSLKHLLSNSQSASISFPSLVFLLSFKDRRLNEPPVGFVAVPRRRRKGLTVATGRLCCTLDVAGFKRNHEILCKVNFNNRSLPVAFSSPCIVKVVLLLPSDSLSGS